MDRLIIAISAALVFGGFAALGLWWVRSQRELHRTKDHRALIRRRHQLRLAFGWLVVGLLIVGAIAIIAGALSR